MNRPLMKPDFVVDSLLGPGLHLLAGASKVGKSWLSLWLAVCIAKGEEIWGLRTKGGETLYLCLEDSEARIQSRLYHITDEAPHTVHFATSACTLGRGLEEQIETFGLPILRLMLIQKKMQRVKQFFLSIAAWNRRPADQTK